MVLPGRLNDYAPHSMQRLSRFPTYGPLPGPDIQPSSDLNFNPPLSLPLDTNTVNGGALNTVPALGANTMNGGALGTVPQQDTGGFLGSGYEFKSPMGDPERRSAFLGFLKMIENSGTPSFKSTMADAAGAAAFGAEHLIQSEAAAREAAMDERLLDVQETTAKAALLKAQTGPTGQFERILANQNLSPEEEAAMRSAWLTAQTTNASATSQFERMLEASDYTPAQKMEISKRFLEAQATAGGGDTYNLFDSRQWTKQVAEYYDDTRAASNGANDMLGTIDNMRDALKDVTTGATKPAILPLVAIAKDLGIDVEALSKSVGVDFNEVASQEMINKYSTELALVMGKEMMKGQGTVTNEERKEVKNMMAQLGNDPATNKRALDDLERWARRRTIKFTKMANWLLDPANADATNLVAFDVEWNAYLSREREERRDELAAGAGGTINTTAPTTITDLQMRGIIDIIGPEMASKIFGGTP